MENYLFEAAMPYCVDIEKGKIRVLNKHYEPLFVGALPKKISLDKVFDFAELPDDDFSIDTGGRIYLYNYTPVGESERIFQYDDLVGYYLRLTHLMEFCAGLQPAGANPLLKR